MKASYLFHFPNLARSSSITLSSNFLNSGLGWFNFCPGLSSLGFQSILSGAAGVVASSLEGKDDISTPCAYRASR